MLTEGEAENLKNDDRVSSVELNPKSLGVGIIRYGGIQQSDFWNKSSTNNSSHKNWGLKRCVDGVQTADWGDNITPNLSGQITLTSSGKNVDVIVIDGHFDPNHPEFKVNEDGTGNSRVIQYNWLQHNPTVTGDAAGVYVYTPYFDALDPDLTADNDHGAHVAGTVAGNTQGWARDANIYNISPYGTNPNAGVSDFFIDYVRAFHASKEINPQTGRKNPTLTNNSYGLSISILISEIQQVNYRGVTHSSPFTSGQLNSWGILNSGGIARFPYRSPSFEADFLDAVTEGILFVGAAGNDSYKIDVIGGLDYNNTLTWSSFVIPYHRGSSPSSEASVLCVGSIGVNSGDAKSSFSNTGPRIDLYAPGSNIISSFISAGESDSRDPSYLLNKISGTSMASPQVCGVLACFLEQYPEINQDDLRSIFVETHVKQNQILDTLGSYTDLFSLQESPNRFLFYKKERPEEGLTFPRNTHSQRSLALSLGYPRTRLRFYGRSTSSTSSLFIDSVDMPSNGNYYESDVITFTVNFNEAAYVTNSEDITLDFALGNDQTVSNRSAYYLSGSGTTALTFTYTFTELDHDKDGIQFNSISLGNAGEIKNIENDNFDLTTSSELAEQVVVYNNFQINELDDIFTAGVDSPNRPVAAGEFVYFGSNDNSAALKLFKSDQSGNITQLTNIRPGLSDTVVPRILFDNHVYFTATDTAARVKLYKVNVSTDVVTKLPDVVSGQSQTMNNFIVFSGHLYFSSSSSLIDKLYKVNTSDVITQVSNTNTSFEGSDVIASPIVYNNNLYFVANNSSSHQKMYRIDSEDQVTATTNINTSVGDNIGFPIIFNNNLYFSASNSDGFNRLYRLNTSNTLAQITNIRPAATDNISNSRAIFNNHLYFGALNGSGVSKLHRINTSETLSQPIDVRGASISDAIGNMVAHNGFLYLAMTHTSASTAVKLVKLTTEHILTQISNTRTAGSDIIANLTSVEETLYFTSNTGGSSGNVSGARIFRANTSDAVSSVSNFNSLSGNDSIANVYLNENNNILYFTGNYGGGGSKLLQVENTVLFQRIDTRTDASDVFTFLKIIGNKAYGNFRTILAANSQQTPPTKLFEILEDGTITQISNTSGSENSGDFVTNMTTFNGAEYFVATSTAGTKLHKLMPNGSIVQVSNINTAGSDSAFVRDVLNNNLYFSASDGVFNKLYKINTSDVVTQVSNVNEGSSDTILNHIVFNNSMYFNLGVAGITKLYKLDSSDNITQVSNTNTSGSDNPTPRLVVDGKMYFTSNNVSNVTKLYWIDSSDTVYQTTEIRASNLADTFSSLISYNNLLYTIANNVNSLSKLFKFSADGSFTQVSNLTGSPSSSDNLSNLVIFNNDLYFSGGSLTKLYKINSSDTITQISNTFSGNADSPTFPVEHKGVLYFSSNIANSISKLFYVTKSGLVKQVSDIRGSGATDAGALQFSLGESLFFMANKSSAAFLQLHRIRPV